MEAVATSMMTNLSNIVGDPILINKFTKLLIKLLVTDIHNLQSNQKQSIDIGVGKLIVVNKVDEIEWSFVPAEELEHSIQRNEKTQLSPVEEDMLKSIVYKIVTKYQELL